MSQNLIMRQMDERQTSQEVKLLVWSPKMDIIATAFENGDVCLYRLQWHRVWVAPASELQQAAAAMDKGPAVTALCWRPDGKLLATGYSSGLLSIRHIESKDSIHTEQLDSKITWISWQNISQSFLDKEDTLYTSLSAISWDFISKLPSLDKIYSYNDTSTEGEGQDCRKLDDSGPESILLVGTNNGSVYLLVFGFLMCARLSVADLVNSPSEVVNAVLASDFKTFSCLIKQEQSYRLITVECPLLATCQVELTALAAKYNLIQGTIRYAEDTIKRIRESWENILLEMDNKLENYAKPNPPGSAAADLMELLLFGTFTRELEKFLLIDMTEKGLKRMGQSIELSYSNIQRLVIRYLHPVCQSLHFQLGELLGLARANHRFAVIGVEEEVILSALKESGLFWSKAVELQRVIDESMNKFKLFFRWLYTEIVRRDEGEVPDELKKTTQHEVLFVADFIRQLDNSASVKEEGGEVSSQVYLERVGQYLSEEDLKQPPNTETNVWNKILQDHPQLQSIPFILPPDSTTSAVSQFNKLTAAVNKIFNKMNTDITCQSEIKLNLELHSLSTESSSSLLRHSSPRNENSDLTFQPEEPCLLSAQLVEDEPLDNCPSSGTSQLSQGAVSWDRSNILYWQLTDKEVRATLLHPQKGTSIVDFSFYTKDILSILLECEETQTLVQLPLTNIQPSLRPVSFTSRRILPDTLSTNDLIEVSGRASCRELENIRARGFAVSGTRNVSVLLFKNGKRLRIYDMEVEEEEDEEMFNSSGPLTETTEQNSLY